MINAEHYLYVTSNLLINIVFSLVLTHTMGLNMQFGWRRLAVEKMVTVESKW